MNQEQSKNSLVFIFSLMLFVIFIAAYVRGGGVKNFPPADNAPYNEIAAKVVPAGGFKTKIVLGNSLARLVEYGVIDLEKIDNIYESRGGLNEWEKNLLTVGSSEPLTLNASNSGFLLNALWGLGLANKTDFNKTSPINGDDLYYFASTGGWILGKAENGGEYFNKFAIIPLTPEQEEIALEVAQNTYRPCCGNSTFFQDCNHGSALLGVIELGAARGLLEEELYKTALMFNSFWFPDTYIKTALYFKIFEDTEWENIDAKKTMSFNYSSASGWYNNIEKKIAAIPGLIPESGEGGKCGV